MAFVPVAGPVNPLQLFVWNPTQIILGFVLAEVTAVRGQGDPLHGRPAGVPRMTHIPAFMNQHMSERVFEIAFHDALLNVLFRFLFSENNKSILKKQPATQTGCSSSAQGGKNSMPCLPFSALH